MQYAKKMALVDPKLLESLNHPRSPPNPIVASMSVLDTEMKQVLDSDHDAVDKVQAYNQILQRYLLQLAKHTEPEFRVRPGASYENKEIVKDQFKEVKLDSVEKDVLETVPKPFLKKAHILMKRLRNNANVQWNEKGEVILNGNHIRGSNLADLVNDVLRNRKNMANPIGWEAFASHLQEMNIPQELVGNKIRSPFIKGEGIPIPPGEVDLPHKATVSPRQTRAKRRSKPYNKWTPYDD